MNRLKARILHFLPEEKKFLHKIYSKFIDDHAYLWSEVENLDLAKLRYILMVIIKLFYEEHKHLHDVSQIDQQEFNRAVKELISNPDALMQKAKSVQIKAIDRLGLERWFNAFRKDIERITQIIKKYEQIYKKPLEETANFQGNDTALLFERLENPRIKQQIINLLVEAYESEYKTSGAPSSLREKIESGVEGDIETAKKVTKISLDPERVHAPSATRGIHLGYKHPDGTTPTTKQWSILAAHEVGHKIRLYDDPKTFFQAYFLRGFDVSKVEFSEKDYKRFKDQTLKYSGTIQVQKPGFTLNGAKGIIEMSFEYAKKFFIEYLFSPTEIAERLSQLKNYFGMGGDDIFTKEHLAYAREHYVKDVGFDNGMSHLLQTVTLETEAEFLEIINNAGI